MINVLINAYAVSPTWGSEPGVGWNWIIHLAKYCKLHVITEGEWRDEIESAMLSLPQAVNISWYFIPASEKVRKMCWNQGDWRFYWYYRKWQKLAWDKAQEILNTRHIDVIHQLNMIGFREPGYLWKIKHLPFVWGPIGGCTITPLEYMEDSSFKEKFFIRLKNCLNELQFRYDPRVCAALRRAAAVITPMREMADEITRKHGNKVLIMPETGVMGECVSKSEKSSLSNGKLNLLWVGRFIHTKKLDLAIRVLSRLKGQQVLLHIVGTGQANLVKGYKDLALKLGVNDMCVWYGMKTNAEVHELMKTMDAFFFTSIKDGTSTVVLEALKNRLPIICHNMCAFGALVREKIGFVIEPRGMQQSIDAFSSLITKINANRSLLYEFDGVFEKYAAQLSYSAKAETIAQLYSRVIEKTRDDNE